MGSVFLGHALVELIHTRSRVGQGSHSAHHDAHHVGHCNADPSGEAPKGDDHQGGSHNDTHNGVEGKVVEMGEQGVNSLGKAQDGDYAPIPAGSSTWKSRLPMPSTKGVYNPRGISRWKSSCRGR